MKLVGHPLDDVRVLDLTRLLPGNYCAWLLGSLGADVIKIEDPGAGDYMRTFGVQVDGQGATHHVVNRGKRSLIVDLKHPEGREAFFRLVDKADVVIESFRPGVMDRLGIGHDTLRARRPPLVVASISSFGADGPLAGTVAHDLNALGFSGFLERLAEDGAPPQAPPLAFADLIGGGLIPALGITALVHRARQTGEGGWIDASLAEGFSSLPSLVLSDLLAGGPVPPRGTPEHGGAPCYRVYELSDGLVVVGAVEQQFWAALCEALDEQDLIEAQWDTERRQEAIDRLSTRFAGMTRAQLADLLAERDTCTTIVQSYEEMIDCEHAIARDLMRPAVDVPMRLPAPPFRIDGQRPPEQRGAPRHGEQTREVMLDCGFDEAEVAALIERGAVRQR